MRGRDETNDGVERGSLRELTRVDIRERRDVQWLDNQSKLDATHDEEHLKPSVGRIKREGGQLLGCKGQEKESKDHDYPNAEVC